MEYTRNPYSVQSGFSSLLLLFILILFFSGVFFTYTTRLTPASQNADISPTITPYPGQKITPVNAHGSITKSKYTVSITLNFALEGGTVSGEFSGACTGTITGDYDGKDGGIISGSASGTCDPLIVPIPASATFTGTVSHQRKTVAVTGTGTVAGISGDGSLSLSF